MKRLAFAVVLSLICLSTSNLYAATYSGGSGTAEDPYQIADANDLLELSTDPNNYDKCFILTADIDLGMWYFLAAAIAPDTDNTDAGFQGAAFTGTFDGNGHKVVNFTIYCQGQDYLGLFGRIGPGGQVTNIGIENCSVSGFNNYYIAQCIGSLAGENAGDVIGCYSSGNVSGDSSVGGLVGRNENSIDSCYSTSDVNGYQEVGGLAGSNYGSLSNCYATGSIHGTSYVGGLIGYNNDIVRNCYSIGVVTGDGYDSSSLGGLVGMQYGLTTNSFWDVPSSGLDYSDGGKGKTTDEMKQAVCYPGWNSPTQIVWALDEGNDYPRLIWENKPGRPMPVLSFSDCVPGSGTISDPYRISTAGQFNLIGLFPELWDKAFCLESNIDLADIAGEDYNPIGVGYDYVFSGVFDGRGFILSNFTYTTASEHYTGLFGYTSNATIENIGIENVNIASNGYSIGGLVGFAYRTEIQNCYCANLTISSFCDNSNIGGLVGYQVQGTMAHCYSMDSMNISITTTPFSYFPFSPSFSVGGLVGFQSSGIITCCHVTGSVSSSLSSSSSSSSSCSFRIGGLMGVQSSGTITCCHVTGSVSSSLSSSSSSYSSCVGGLAGYQDYGTITNCYIAGSVVSSCYVNGENTEGYYSCSVIDGTIDFFSRSYAGGLVGCQSSGTITSCCNKSSVVSSVTAYSFNLSESYAGGLAGYQGNNSSAIIERCYSTGGISATESAIYKGGLLGYKYGSGGTIAGCFWDTETSGLDYSDGGSGVQGKTTAEMQTLSTFIDAGWDFTNETANGTNDFWRMCDGMNYPKLNWQEVIAGDFVCPDGVDFMDYAVLAKEWMLEKLSYDVTPDNGDGIVNFADWAIFASNWDGDIGHLYDFMSQWLESGASCDIAPEPDGDGVVDMLDLALFAENWLAGQ